MRLQKSKFPIVSAFVTSYVVVFSEITIGKDTPVVNLCRILETPFDRSTRLAELELDENILGDSVLEGLSFARQTTPNDPVILYSFIAWGKITGCLRTRLIPYGWHAKQIKKQETTTNPDGQRAVIIASGDTNTGRTLKTPSTRSPKGSATKDAIDRNQLRFADMSLAFADDLSRANIPTETWVLLYFVDNDVHEVRVELSLPSTMDNEGCISEWSERIILSSLHYQASINVTSESEEDETEEKIEIERRVR